MNEYRVTFPRRYPVGSIGRDDPKSRQGYYVLACSASHAILANVADGSAREGENADVEFFRKTSLKVTCDYCGEGEE